MPVAKPELLTMIDDAIALRAGHEGPIGGGRRLFLIDLKRLVEAHGLPLPDQFKLDACANPFVGHELNYDDFDWTKRTAELGHLGDMVEIDVIVWSGGLRRSELTDAEYSQYFQHCLRASEYRRKHKAR